MASKPTKLCNSGWTVCATRSTCPRRTPRRCARACGHGWTRAGESEDLGGGAQSARAAYQLTASKAPTFVNGHAKAVMRSPAAAGCQPRCSTLIGPPSSAKIAAAAPAGNADSVDTLPYLLGVKYGFCGAPMRPAGAV